MFILSIVYERDARIVTAFETEAQAKVAGLKVVLARRVGLFQEEAEADEEAMGAVVGVRVTHITLHGIPEESSILKV